MTIYTNFTKGVLLGVKAVDVTSPFGKRTYFINGKWVTDFHNGIDMKPAVKVGPIERGKVIEIRDDIKESETPAILASLPNSKASGNYIVLLHGNGTHSFHKHLAYGSIKVKVGDIVDREQELATAGSTGGTTGKHDHFEIRLGSKTGTPVDPMPYLQGLKTIAPYTEPTTTVIDHPTNAKLLVLVADQNYRAEAGTAAKVLGKLQQNKAYAYIGKTAEIDDFNWAQIKVDNQCVYAALNPEWNKLQEPDPIIIIKPVESPIDTTMTDGSITAHITRGIPK